MDALRNASATHASWDAAIAQITKAPEIRRRHYQFPPTDKTVNGEITEEHKSGQWDTHKDLHNQPWGGNKTNCAKAIKTTGG